MPVRACSVQGLPAVRWGRRGTPYAYGDGTGRTLQQAYQMAARQGLAWAARRLERDRALGRVDAVRGVLRKGPRRKGRQVGLVPDTLVQRYEAMLTARLRTTARLALEFSMPYLREMEADAERRRELLAVLEQRADARAKGTLREDSGGMSGFLGVLSVVRGVASRFAWDDRDGLTYIGEEVDDLVSDDVDGQLSRLLNIPLAMAAGSQERVDQWVEENIGLITRLNQAQCDELEKMVHEAMSAGTSTLELAKTIEQKFDRPWWHASLLARDQTAKLASQINQARQEDYGITHYQWSTSGDPRVRQKHAELDGQIFSWAEGAPGQRGRIHPGLEFQCRCVAIPVMPDGNVVEMIARAEARQERELRLMMRSPTVRGEIPNLSKFSDWNRSRIEDLRKGMREAVGLPGPDAPPITRLVRVPRARNVAPNAPPVPRAAPKPPGPSPKPSWKPLPGGGYVLAGGPHTGATLKREGKQWVLQHRGQTRTMPKRAQFGHAESLLKEWE